MKNIFEKKRILVLGGMGFIGSNLAIRLNKFGGDVKIVDSMLPQYGGNVANIDSIKDSCQVNFADIRDQHSMNYLVQRADIIYSMAGQTSHVDSMTDPITDLDINCRSQLALLESCRLYNPGVTIVYASTRQLYGRPQYLPVDEDHPIEPVDVNGINKLAAEMYYTLYSQVYGMNCVSLRLTNTYGPRQHLQGNNQGFAGIFIRMAIKGEKIKIFGTGEQRRDFNYIDDVVEALLLAAASRKLKGMVFNLGAREHYSLLEFVQHLGSFCDFTHELVPFPAEHKVIDIGDYYGDFSRFEAATGWTPRVNLHDGLERTVDYFKSRGHLYWGE
ncbi:MAG: NAD-dependent epimerase/dehydratase family protein [Deltaproteobacteria bacterium]|nr:NAD-dependent epimerase/dehydratase family protein [Deltaproteobacteria bacterium]MBW2658019.1 NAD-dependent epimerase/dehydratase family protein [Deltaproteobacteria bacterium]